MLVANSDYLHESQSCFVIHRLFSKVTASSVVVFDSDCGTDFGTHRVLSGIHAVDWNYFCTPDSRSVPKIASEKSQDWVKIICRLLTFKVFMRPADGSERCMINLFDICCCCKGEGDRAVELSLI